MKIYVENVEIELTPDQIKTIEKERSKRKRETPLAVKRKDFIVVVSDSNITIERNVI